MRKRNSYNLPNKERDGKIKRQADPGEGEEGKKKEVWRGCIETGDMERERDGKKRRKRERDRFRGWGVWWMLDIEGWMDTDGCVSLVKKGTTTPSEEYP